jgi:hypothetical protein
MEKNKGKNSQLKMNNDIYKSILDIYNQSVNDMYNTPDNYTNYTKTKKNKSKSKKSTNNNIGTQHAISYSFYPDDDSF